MIVFGSAHGNGIHEGTTRHQRTTASTVQRHFLRHFDDNGCTLKGDY